MPDRPSPESRVQWLRGISWLSGGTVLSLGASAVAGILIARLLGPSGFGIYAFVTVATSLLSMVSGYGLNLHLVTILKRDRGDSKAYAEVSRVAYCLSGLAAVVGAAVAWLAFSPHIRLPLMIDLGEVLFAPLMLRQVILQVRSRQRDMILAQMANRLAWILYVTLTFALPPAHILVWLMIGRVAVLLLWGVVLRAMARLPGRNTRTPRASLWPFSSYLGVVRASAPLAIGSLLGTGYNRIDQLLLTGIRGSYATGLYAGAVRLAELPGSFPSIVQNVSMPTFVRAHQSREGAQLSSALTDALLLTIIPSGLAVSLLAGLGGPLIVLVLGRRFGGAATALVILAAADWMRLPGTVYTTLAIAVDRRRVLAIAIGCGFAVNLVINLALIPLIGALGAAVASLFGYGTSALLTARAAHEERRTLRPSYLLTVRLGAAAAGAAGLGHVFRVPLPADAAVIATSYLIAIVLVLPRSERLRLQAVVMPPFERAVDALRYRS